MVPEEHAPDFGRSDQLSLRFSERTRRRADRASDDEARLVWILLTLLRARRVDFRAWYAQFEKSERTFDRDVAKLRDLGTRCNFTLTGKVKGEVRLKEVGGIADPARKAERLAADALAGLVDALGEVVASSLHGYVDFGGSRFDRFLRFATPRLVASEPVGSVYQKLREAWSKRAAIRFSYPSRDGSRSTERIVEPYLVTYNAGRYYLVGWDTHARRGGWRQYALDRIVGEIQRSHSFTPRPVPSAYSGIDAVGLFKHGSGDVSAPSVDVTIELSNVIAAAVTARSWQAEQRVGRRGDAVTITFAVQDVGEAVRWAFGFGVQARVVDPPQAVALARETAYAMLAAYDAASADRSALN